LKKISFPLKEYFIWGDDMEYTARMKNYGVEIASIVDAYFYHPKDESLGTPMFFNKLHFNDTPSKLKLYCMCRMLFLIIKSTVVIYMFSHLYLKPYGFIH